MALLKNDLKKIGNRIIRVDYRQESFYPAPLHHTLELQENIDELCAGVE
ncbi:hypothetical protein ACG2F4_18910 [Halalkalibaculum sp. DA3122]